MKTRKKIGLFLLVMCLFGSISAYGQYSIGGTAYANLSAAFAAVPTSGVQTTIDVTSDVVETASATLGAGKNALLKSSGGSFTVKVGTVIGTEFIRVAGGATLEMQSVIIDGGAIWSNEALSIQGDTSRTNSGVATGYALINNQGKLTLGSGAILQNNDNSGNTTSSVAGAIVNVWGGELTMNAGSVIRRCEVTRATGVIVQAAGAIFSTNSKIYMNGDATIVGCKVETDNTVSSTVARAGGVVSYGSAIFEMNDNSQISACYTNYRGGGVLSQGSFTMNDNASIHNCYAWYSGGIAMFGSSAITTMNDNASVHDNKVEKFAGGIELGYSGNVANSVLNLNGSSSVYNNESLGSAGGINNFCGIVNLNENSSVHHNTAGTFSGAISVIKGGRVFMNDNASIVYNKSATGAGGVMTQGKQDSISVFTMSGAGCKVNNNTVSGSYGGGLYVQEYSIVNISDGEVCDNTSLAGGGMYMGGGTVNLSGGKISRNTSSIMGGGIVTQAVTTLNFTGGEITENVSVTGGGIAMATYSSMGTIVNIVGDAVIKDNVATKGRAIQMRPERPGAYPFVSTILNIDGSVTIEGDINLEKDASDTRRNKYITLVGEPTSNYTISTDPATDSPYGRVVVVPGSTTVGGTTYSLTDATPYAANFTHNVKPVVEGIPGTFTESKLMLGCFAQGGVTIIRNSLNRKLDSPQEIRTNIDPAFVGLTYEWTFPGGQPSSSTAPSTIVTWPSAEARRANVSVHIYETGIIYPPSTDPMLCDNTITEEHHRLFVDKDAIDGERTGESWENAYLNVDTALSKAGYGDDIWVADGEYTPGPGKSFEMNMDGVRVFGGFSGVEADLDQRDFATNKTILKGNNASVIKIDGTSSFGAVCGISREARWDGFIIENGIADRGAGIYNDNGSPTIAYCIIRNNAATAEGGGVYSIARATCYDGSPLFLNVEISGNKAQSGAGLYNMEGDFEMLNVTVGGNSASTLAGGIYSKSAAPLIQNSIIYGNITTSTPLAGEFINDGGSPAFEYSIIGGSRGSGSWDTTFGTDGGHNVDKNPVYRRGGYTSDGIMREGNYRIVPQSPAYNSGYNPYVDGLLPTDLDYADRIYGDIVDMGAYEYHSEDDKRLQHEVIINTYEGATTTPPAGIHYADAHWDYTVTFYPKDGYSLQYMTVTTGSDLQDNQGGQLLTRNPDGSVTVIFQKVSEPLDIKIDGVSPTSNEAVEDMVALWSNEGNLYVQVAKTQTLNIYTVSGMLYKTQTVSAGETIVPMERGLYIVTLANGTKQKVVIR